MLLKVADCGEVINVKRGARPMIPSQQDSTLPTLSIRRPDPFKLPAQYAWLRSEKPICRITLPTGEPAWLVTSHELVRKILADRRVSVDRTDPRFPTFSVMSEQERRHMHRPLAGDDAPRHSERRRLLVPEFTLRRIQAMRPRIQELVDARITEILKCPRPLDLVQALSVAIPSQVICELLGVPYDDHEFFESRTRTVAHHHTPADERMKAHIELLTYIDGLVRRKETDPGDDLISRLIVRDREAQVFGHDEIAGIARVILLAGHGTTSNMISLGVVALLDNPEQLAVIQHDPQATRDAVEELLRYFSVTGPAISSRLATADIELGGELIRAGEGIIALVSAANRDDKAFESPEVFDIRRGAQHHVAFGYGAHQCLGQSLARLELEIVFSTLFTRVPDLRLARPVTELAFKYDEHSFGVYELPVTWGAAGGCPAT
jgi:cytochrome P450